MTDLQIATCLLLSLVCALIGAGRAALIYVTDVQLMELEFSHADFANEVGSAAAIYFSVCVILCFVFVSFL